MKQLYIISLIILSALCNACHTTLPPASDSGEEPLSDDSAIEQSDSESDLTMETDSEPTAVTHRADQNKALLIVVDNAQSMMNSAIENLYTQYPNEISSALADLYQQPVAEIKSRTLTEIAEDFGEDWIIEDILNAAGNAYSVSVILTDEQATLDNFLSALEQIQQAGMLVDIVMDLHGSSAAEIAFNDEVITSEELTMQIQSRKIHVSAVYQTLCYGSIMIEDWEAIQVDAVNGGVGNNMYVNFAPGAFMDYWLAGWSYDDAVQQARTDDMTEMQSRLISAAVDNAELSLLLSFYDFDSQSPQIVGGMHPNLGW